MNIQANSLYQEMQSMVVGANNPFGEIKPNLGNSIQGNLSGIGTQSVAPSASSDFGAMLKNAIDNVNQLQKTSSEKQTAFEMGDSSVSLGDAMIASQKASVAFEATVQVRNKLVEAYKEIMNMPV